jgi:hypothetical protein
MSSAKSDTSHPSSGFGKSDIIMLNSSGLSTHRWDTPLLSFLSGDRLLSTRTAMFLSVMKFFIQRSTGPYILSFVIL